MKICWDNLENMRYSKKTGKWYNGNGGGYIGVDSCKNCHEPFLSREGNSDFCSPSCRNSGKNNPMYGKTHTDEVKRMLAKQKRKYPLGKKTKFLESLGFTNISQLEYVKKKKGQFIVNFNNVSEFVNNEGYILLELNGDNKHSIMKLKCPSKHTFKIKYHSFQKGHRCVECYYDRLRQQGIQDLQGYRLYKQHVYNYTKISYRKYENVINPLKLERGRGKYHLDHMYSISEGFKNNVPSYITGSFVNLEMLTESDNCSKMDKCSITKEELFDGYFRKT